MAELDDLIRLTNPWWEAPERINEDPHLRAFQESAFQWDPPVLREIELSSSAIHTLRGPRQVGKTTTLKRVVSKLLETGEQRVGYYSFDLDVQPERILDVIRRMRQLHPHGEEGRWFLLLDEVTQIPDWQRGVKYAWDAGLIRDDVLILSGSSARDLIESAELMPGRRGQGNDYTQLPLSFRAFAEAVKGIELPVPMLDPREVGRSANLRHVRQTALRLDDLNHSLDLYLESGGMPAPIRDILEHGAVEERTLREIWQAVAGDVTKAGLDRIAALKMLERVAISLGSSLSWTAAAEAMDVVPNTAKKYVEFLTLGFTLLPVYFWDLSSSSYNPSKQRKVYFLDPVFARLPGAAGLTARRAEPSGLVEGVVAASLFHSIGTRLVETFPLPHALAYWRATSGREIDFLAHPQEGPVPIEVKWGDSETGISRARRAILASFKGGLVLTRTKLDLEHEVPTMPASCFLYLVSVIA